jgi:hypothetical protein
LLSDSPRNLPRAKLHAQVVVEGHQGANSSQALLIDVSESGAKVIGQRLAKKSDDVLIQWPVIPGSHPLAIKGKVVWAQASSIGIQFVGLSPKALSVLRALVRIHRA